MCTKCALVKPLTDYYERIVGSGRLTSECKPCYSVRSRASYRKHIVARKAYARVRDQARRPWVAYKKSYCERCGFKAKHPCQLDVDHVDNNKLNNDPNNFMTLCANCHRLKSFETKAHTNRYTTITAAQSAG